MKRTMLEIITAIMDCIENEKTVSRSKLMEKCQANWHTIKRYLEIIILIQKKPKVYRTFRNGIIYFTTEYPR